LIAPKEACGRGRQAYIDTIPDDLKDDICTCLTKPDHLVHSQTKKLPNSGDVGITVHERCGKPANLWTYIEICENCEYYYIVSKFPDRDLLCSGCNF